MNICELNSSTVELFVFVWVVLKSFQIESVKVDKSLELRGTELLEVFPGQVF